MSTDRELLEMAAKAAGMRVLSEGSKWPREDIGWFFCERGDGGALFDRSTRSLTKWDPLTDDGDALRLAVKLKICIEFGHCLDDAPVVRCGPEWQRDTWPQVGCFPDPHKETRRAIVRAAAEIGKAMS